MGKQFEEGEWKGRGGMLHVQRVDEKKKKRGVEVGEEDDERRVSGRLFT